jgi:hypothetical protein
MRSPACSDLLYEVLHLFVRGKKVPSLAFSSVALTSF